MTWLKFINTKNFRSFITVKAHCSMTHLKQQKTIFFLVLHWAMDVIKVIYYIYGPVEQQKKPNDFCCLRCVIEQQALTVIKLLRFFVLIFAVFSTRSSHRRRSYSISYIGNMMGCDHPSCVPVGPLAGELWYLEYFPTTTVRHSEF